MCRLYGFRASQPARLECALVRAQNALLVQSRADRRGTANTDGWGVGFYEDGKARVEKCEAAAYEDMHFLEAARRISSSDVVAHVRRATVGKPSRVNTHPFRAGRWLFAHNGTLPGFRELAPGLEAASRSELLEMRRGSTDSELMFVWIMSRLAEAGVEADSECTDHALLAAVFSRCVSELAGMAEQARSGSLPELNFLLTDGHLLAASRWGISLYFLIREGASDCGICGAKHVAPHRAGAYRAAAIASEPITRETWTEVPDRSFLVITSEIRGYTGSIE